MHLALDTLLCSGFRSAAARAWQVRGSPEQTTDQWTFLVHFAALGTQMHAVPLLKGSLMLAIAFSR